MNKLRTIFKKDDGILIGAVHLAPSPGFPGAMPIDASIRNAIRDTKAFLDEGMDAVIFENNYDLPHTEHVGATTIVAMSLAGSELRRRVGAPLGVNVLWNDHEASLGLATGIGLQFVRIPVFVDTVQTSYGKIAGSPKKIAEFRRALGAEKIALFADIHVKHAKLISKMSLIRSAKEAIRHGADAVIVTGKWTGDAPDVRELAALRSGIGKFPIIVGSGADQSNIGELLRFANGAIVSTALKHGGKKAGQVNVKGYSQRIDPRKVATFVAAARVR